MEVGNDENLDILLKYWDTSNIKELDNLTEEKAIQYVKQLKDSGTEKREKHLYCGTMIVMMNERSSKCRD